MFKWLFGRKSIGSIVASITKMRAELKTAIDDANEEIKARGENIKKAEEKKTQAIEKANTKFVAKESKERKQIDLAKDEIVDAESWLGALPTIGDTAEPASSGESETPDNQP